MLTRRALVLIAVVAALHGVFFLFYQAPEWSTVADQEGYRRLGQALAETGQFTRYPDAPQFVPEVIRTPGYPLFLAAVYALAGPSQVAVAISQIGLTIALALLVAVIARACAPPRVAVAAGLAAALYPTFPYFAALAMTELWTTFVLTAAMAVAFRAHRTGATRDYLATGFLLGFAALSRPAFVLLPLAFVGTAVVLFRRASGRVLRPWPLLLAAFVLTLLPWFTFNYVVMGRFALAPAGGVGRGLWEGSWHGRWPGRIQNELTQIAADTANPRPLDARVAEFAERTGYDPDPMMRYVTQWTEIRRIWDEPVDPEARAVARVHADAEYRRVALDNIGQDVVGHIRRRLTHGLFVLWSTDIWLRYSTINAAPPALIRAMWAVQAALLAFAAWGTWRLLREGRMLQAWLLVTPLLYVTVVHVPLLTEARQSLPVKPLLLILATIGLADAGRRLFPLKPQVHERQHV